MRSVVALVALALLWEPAAALQTLRLAPRHLLRASWNQNRKGRPLLAASFELAPTLGDAVAGLREALSSVEFGRTLEFPTVPALPLRGVGYLREFLNEYLLNLRFGAVVVTLLAAGSAAVLGLAIGDRTTTPTVEQSDAVLLSAMPVDTAAEFDRGDDDCYGEDGCILPSDETPPVSAGLWLELGLCVLLDLGGVASYYFPNFGELSDVGFAVLNAFAIELFFDWPTMALVGFWEELLPLTDVVPTATITWILVVSNARPAIRSVLGKGAPTAPSARNPPLSDRASYGAAEPHLQPGNRPWEI